SQVSFADFSSGNSPDGVAPKSTEQPSDKRNASNAMLVGATTRKSGRSYVRVSLSEECAVMVYDPIGRSSSYKPAALMRTVFCAVWPLSVILTPCKTELP